MVFDGLKVFWRREADFPAEESGLYIGFDTAPLPPRPRVGVYVGARSLAAWAKSAWRG